VFGGVAAQSSNTLSACQDACTGDPRCSAVDYSADNRRGWRCFVIRNNATVNVGLTLGVTHYSLARNCELCRFLSGTKHTHTQINTVL